MTHPMNPQNRRTPRVSPTNPDNAFSLDSMKMYKCAGGYVLYGSALDGEQTKKPLNPEPLNPKP